MTYPYPEPAPPAQPLAPPEEPWLDARPVATWVLGAVMLVLFVVESTCGGSSSGVTLLRMGANSGTRVMDGQWWRVLSSAFLHIGVLHLACNAWAIWIFGRFLERSLGSGRYLLLYGLSALGGGLASALVQPTHLSAGASGALWGLMTGTLALVMRPQGWLPRRAAQAMRSTAWQPVLFNLLYSFTPGIDVSAHLGGGLVGFLVVWLGLATGPRSGAARATWRTAGALIVSAGMAASVVTALWEGAPWELVMTPETATVPVGAFGLVVSVPQPLAGRRRVFMHKTQQEFTFGRLDEDPVSVSILVQRLPQPVEDVDAFLEEFRQVMDARPSEDAVRRAPTVRMGEGGEASLFSDEEYPSRVRCPRTLRLVGKDILVVVQVFTRPEASDGWRAAGSLIAGTVRSEGP
jgi:membrane associated rhomboid family serine protease